MMSALYLTKTLS